MSVTQNGANHPIVSMPSLPSMLAGGDKQMEERNGRAAERERHDIDADAGR